MPIDPMTTRFATHDLARGAARRGSVLIITMIFAAGVALSLGSFLALSLNSAKLSRQSFQANGALNLAEAGLELALNAMNSGSYSSWSTHASGANARYMVVNNIDLGPGTTGQVRVLINDITGVTRRIVAEGIATPSSGPAVRKQIELQAARRSLFATGLVSKDTMTFSGNGVSVNSWSSDPDNNPSTAAVPYSAGVSDDNGSIASTAVTITIGNADVWGYVATGGGQPNVGPNGTIAAYGNVQGTVDQSRIAKDFKYNFEDVEVPVPSSINIINSTIGSGLALPLTLPRAGDVTAIDSTDGVAKYFYQLPGIDASGNSSKILTISDDVVLLPTAGSGATAIGIGGNASINITNTGTLAIYTQGDIAIAGNGIVNGDRTANTLSTQLSTANQPKAMQIYGTNTSVAGQNISISGNGVLSAIGYAPNANLTINGGGSNGHVLGAFVAKTVTITGGNSFHYDESLKNLGGDNPFELSRWRELFGSERVDF
jgi:hypothetical protein